MNKNMKFTGILAILLVLVLYIQTVFAGGTVTNSVHRLLGTDEKVTVKLNGNTITFPDAQPFIDENDRTQVPIRFIAEAMGCTVSWDDPTQTAIIVKGNKTIKLTIGDYGALVNNERHTLDTAAVLKEDRTFVPLRFVSEILGATVGWDENTNTVSITDSTITYTPSPTATPTPTPIVRVHTPSPATPTPTPTNDVPSFNNPIIGKPYYGNGITGKDDLSKFDRLSGLFNYDDIIAIGGPSVGETSDTVNISYGAYNEVSKRVEGYLSVTFSEKEDEQFSITLSNAGDTQMERLKEIINIGVIGDQDYKDFVYNKAVEVRNNGGFQQPSYTDGSTICATRKTGNGYDNHWVEGSIYIKIWR